jgi:hypothetical protein
MSTARSPVGQLHLTVWWQISSAHWLEDVVLYVRFLFLHKTSPPFCRFLRSHAKEHVPVMCTGRRAHTSWLPRPSAASSANKWPPLDVLIFHTNCPARCSGQPTLILAIQASVFLSSEPRGASSIARIATERTGSGCCCRNLICVGGGGGGGVLIFL